MKKKKEELGLMQFFVLDLNLLVLVEQILRYTIHNERVRQWRIDLPRSTQVQQRVMGMIQKQNLYPQPRAMATF